MKTAIQVADDNIARTEGVIANYRMKKDRLTVEINRMRFQVEMLEEAIGDMLSMLSRCREERKMLDSEIISASATSIDPIPERR